MRWRIVFSLVLITLAGGCAHDLVGPANAAILAHGLLISITAPGRCLFTCDPAGANPRELGLITLTNTGSAKVFVPLCANEPVLREQQFVNGQWVTVPVPFFDCGPGPNSGLIMPHDSLQFNMWFEAGTWRMTIGAAADTALATESLSASAPVDVK